MEILENTAREILENKALEILENNALEILENNILKILRKKTAIRRMRDCPFGIIQAQLMSNIDISSLLIEASQGMGKLALPFLIFFWPGGVHTVVFNIEV